MEQNITLTKNRNIFGKKALIGGFIAAHGAMHAFMLSTPRPDGGMGNFVTRGGDIPMLNSLGMDAAGVEALGAALMLVTAAGLLLSALLYFRQVRGWQTLLVTSSVVSIAAMFLFWNDWMVAAPVIGIGLIALAVRSRIAKGVQA